MAGYFNTNATVSKTTPRDAYLKKHGLNLKIGQPTRDMCAVDPSGHTHLVDSATGTHTIYKYNEVKEDVSKAMPEGVSASITATGLQSENKEMLVQGLQKFVQKTRKNVTPIATAS